MSRTSAKRKANCVRVCQPFLEQEPMLRDSSWMQALDKVDEIATKVKESLGDAVNFFEDQHRKYVALHEDATLEIKSCQDECARLRRECEAECESMRQASLVESEEILRQAKKGLEEVDMKHAALDLEVRKMEGIYDFQTSKVVLDVGGHTMNTSLQTLTSVPGSLLETMFSGRYPHEPDSATGAFFIDRDGEHFRHVLNFLREPHGFAIHEMPRCQQAELVDEATHYGLRDLMFPYWDAQENGIRLLRNALCLPQVDKTALLDATSQAQSVVVQISSEEVRDEFSGIYVLSDQEVNGAPSWVQQLPPEADREPCLLWFRESKVALIGPSGCSGDNSGHLVARGLNRRTPADLDASWLMDHVSATSKAWNATAPATANLANMQIFLPCQVTVEVLCAVPEDVREMICARALLAGLTLL